MVQMDRLRTGYGILPYHIYIFNHEYEYGYAYDLARKTHLYLSENTDGYI